MLNNINCIAVSDLHGKLFRYEKLFELIRNEQPEGVFIAGDLTGGYYRYHLGEDLSEFFSKFLKSELHTLQAELGENYPDIFIILGNDDPRVIEESVIELDNEGLVRYMHNKRIKWHDHFISGYSFVPPTPFQMKDWEKYDVSRYVDVGAIPPTAGFRTVEADELEIEWGTIKRDLEMLYDDNDLSMDVCIFHSPPYKTDLDRAALDGKMIDYAPLDVHVGSIAIKEFISRKKPLLTLHGHVHESTGITGNWQQQINETRMYNCATNKKELAVIRFDLKNLIFAERSLI